MTLRKFAIGNTTWCDGLSFQDEVQGKIPVHVGKVSLLSFLSSKLEDTSIRIYHSLLKCFFYFIKTIQLIPRKKKLEFSFPVI